MKDKYLGKTFCKKLSNQLKTVCPKFDRDAFYKAVTSGLANRELKERIGFTTETVAEFLPGRFCDQLDILYRLSEIIEPDFGYLFMPGFAARFGMDDYDLSMKALRDFTEYSTSELAIRSFLQRDFDKTIKIMYQWAEHDNHHVRRLASEGSRPRLPWANHLERLKEDPSPVRPILEALKTDPDKYVQKSVANHINDITKDNPQYALDLMESWDRSDANTAWIVKHASRTLIKKGDPSALGLFGFDPTPGIELMELRLENNVIRLGEKLNFSFSILSISGKPQKLSIDYKIHYVKKSGKTSPKVFKLKEVTLDGGATCKIEQSRLFDEFTTRKHYSGEHTLDIVINGIVSGSETFQLKVP